MPQAGKAEPDQGAGLLAAIDKILGRVNSPVNNAAMPAKRSKLESFGFARAVHVRGYHDQPKSLFTAFGAPDVLPAQWARRRGDKHGVGVARQTR